MQHAQIELHEIPANDRIGIMPLHPPIELVQHQCACIAVLEIEVDLAGVAVRRPEHIDLALSAAFERNGVQLAVRGGFDVERNQFECRAIVRCRLHFAVEQETLAIRLAAEPYRCRNEPFHQIALRRANICLIHLNAVFPEEFFELEQLAILAAIHAEYGPLPEIGQRQRPQFDLTLIAQQRFCLFALLSRNERNGGLRRQT